MNDQTQNRELSDADLEHVSAGKQMANPVIVGSRRGAGRAASLSAASRPAVASAPRGAAPGNC